MTQDLNVTDKKRDNQMNLFDCYDVTDEKEGNGESEGVDMDRTEKWETGTI